MPGVLAPVARQRVFTDLGVVAPGAKLYTFVSGTPATPLPTWSNPDLAAIHLNANPIVASAGGLFGPIYLPPNVAYHFVLTDALGLPIWDQDPVTADGTGGTVSGAVGDGIVDDAPTIQAALTYAGTVGAPSTVVQLAAGTFKLGSTLTVPDNVTLRGQGITSILKPIAGVTTCVTLGGAATLERVFLDGVNTTSAVGIGIGVVTLVGNLFIREVEVYRFKGANAVGLYLSQGVTVAVYDSYFNNNETNLRTGSALTGTPTNSIFCNCQFREAVHRGAWIQGAYSTLFLSCLFESNAEEGIYFGNATGLNALDVRLFDCWFENNWNSLALGALRHAQYECVVVGAGAGTIRPELRSCYFNGGATSARSIHFTAAVDYLIDHVKVFNEAANILIDGSNFGTFTNWPSQNGGYASTVSFAGTAIASNVQASVEDGWTPWVPAVTAVGAMTTTAVVVSRAKYKVVGKLLHVSLYVTWTIGGVLNTNVSLTLPAGVVVATDQFTYAPCHVIDAGGLFVGGTVRPIVGPTPDKLQVYLVGFGNWAAGGSGVAINLTCELV